ncbi:mCG144631, partial [Mus musculus]
RIIFLLDHTGTKHRSSCLCSWSCDSTKELTLLMNKNIDCEPLTLHHICVDGNNGQPALNVLDKVY